MNKLRKEQAIIKELQGKTRELEKELRSVKANIIRKIKKNHPKGFCYICGKGKKTTAHHLRKTTLKRKEKVVGIIPLCRDCHDSIESMKKFKKLRKAYKRGFEDGLNSKVER